MSTNKLTITAMAVILTAFTQGAAAAPDDKDNPGKARHEQQDVDSHKQGQGNQGSDVEIVVRGENEGWRNEGWSSEGRRSESWVKDDNRGNENSNRQSDLDSTRGQERAEERRSDNVVQHGLTEKKFRWWWPFN